MIWTPGCLIWFARPERKGQADPLLLHSVILQLAVSLMVERELAFAHTTFYLAREEISNAVATSGPRCIAL